MHGTGSFVPAPPSFSYHTDALGSVVAITSEAGTVVASYRYGAFGELVSIGGTNAELAARNPLRYRAYYYDTHSALYYLPARYYDPASARFLLPDPAPASAGDPRTLDRYMYCTGDPVNYYDPTGAYLDAGGGASKVSDEAIALAKDDLAAAIAMQDAYRKAVAASYANGLSYDAAHAAAEQAAAERAAALAEREQVGGMRGGGAGGGTPYGRYNAEFRPSAPIGPDAALGVGLNIFGCVPYVGFLADAGSVTIDLVGWTRGEATAGDIVLDVVCFVWDPFNYAYAGVYLVDWVSINGSLHHDVPFYYAVPSQ